jgi:hypothetical protein
MHTQSFYSTQCVHQDTSEASDIMMKYAGNSWMFFAVSIPLTLFTITVWYTWANYMRLYPRVVGEVRGAEREDTGACEKLQGI